MEIKNHCDALLCTRDICDYLEIKKGKLYRLIASGMPARKEGQRNYTSSKSAIDQWFHDRAMSAAIDHAGNAKSDSIKK